MTELSNPKSHKRIGVATGSSKRQIRGITREITGRSLHFHHHINKPPLLIFVYILYYSFGNFLKVEEMNIFKENVNGSSL